MDDLDDGRSSDDLIRRSTTREERVGVVLRHDVALWVIAPWEGDLKADGGDQEPTETPQLIRHGSKFRALIRV